VTADIAKPAFSGEFCEKSAGCGPRKGLEGCGAAPMCNIGAGAIAEPRNARFPAQSAGNAPVFKKSSRRH
jgi:hypothetical protein